MCFSQESQTYIVCSPHIWKNIVSCLSSVPVFYGEKASPASRRILSKLEGETIFIYSLQLNNFLCAQSLQLCSTLCDPMDCSPPNSSVHGILQARILEWVAISFSRGSFLPRDQIASIRWIMEKAREFQRNIYFCFIDCAKAFDWVDHNKHPEAPCKH